MPYLIDGHNLIPKVPGLSLDDPEDEIALVKMLQEFCRINRKQVEVFFDNAPPGGQNARSYGRVLARFVRQGGTADQAIQRKLKRLGGEARNWSVVSSDREVQAAARTARAKIIPAEEFARKLIQLSDSDQEPIEEDLSQEEVEDWIDFFGFEEQADGEGEE
jgi:predicted RNA-binding protein with PIN domain